MEPSVPVDDPELATGISGVPALPSYGLKHQVLSPLETLAQSISTIAPTTSPVATIPLVFLLAGNGTWLAYLFATIAVMLVALCISRFARYSASPGSLYIYATSSLPPALGAVAAWALLLAYIATGTSVVGGFINYGNVLLFLILHHPVSPALLAVVVVAGCVWIAYSDAQVSARIMLWIEAISVLLIGVVLVILLVKHGFHIDPQQIRLKGVTPAGVRLGVVLAIFSYVGHESATTLGAEAKDPLRTIPRAVIQSALLSGIFFILAAYTEVLGFHAVGQNLGESTAPLHVLSTEAGIPIFGTLIDIGALISIFACTLACITAAARVMLLMARNGLIHTRLGRTHQRNETPGIAVILSGVLTLAPALALSARHVSGLDIYGWMGSLATYGFITTYALVAVALPFYLRRIGHLTIATLALAAAATIAMVLALAGSIYPVPAAPYNWLPYFYLIYLLAGLTWYADSRRTENANAA
ncbi:MAG: APC family permease [Acidobacteriaceae bacterium]